MRFLQDLAKSTKEVVASSPEIQLGIAGAVLFGAYRLYSSLYNNNEKYFDAEAQEDLFADIQDENENLALVALNNQLVGIQREIAVARQNQERRVVDLGLAVGALLRNQAFVDAINRAENAKARAAIQPLLDLAENKPAARMQAIEDINAAQAGIIDGLNMLGANRAVQDVAKADPNVARLMQEVADLVNDGMEEQNRIAELEAKAKLAQDALRAEQQKRQREEAQRRSWGF